jgi:hypothetical protein
VNADTADAPPMAADDQPSGSFVPALSMSPDHDFIGVNRRGIGGIGVPRLKPSGA